jgi:mRNA interferase MazF
MTNSLPMNFQRGNVVLCSIPMPSTQLQQFKVRPAVVVSANRVYDSFNDVMVVPCTSNTDRSLTVTQYLIAGEEIVNAGIKVESVIRCESIFTLNQSMIIRILGSLTPETMNQVNHCLMLALDLHSVCDL